MTDISSNSKKVVWAVWMIASLFYAYQYILRVMPNILLQDIMRHFGIHAGAFGQFTGVYYIGYSLMHLPVGICLDRFGPKKVMTFCIVLTVIGLMPLLFASHWVYPVVGRFLIGLGSSAAILGIFKVIRMTFSEKQFPRMLSISVMIGLMGAIYGGGPLSYLHETFGYTLILQILAIVGLFLAIVTYWIITDHPISSQSSIYSDIKEVLGNQKVIWSCLFAGLMVVPLEGFADVWGTVFLKEVYGLEGTLAASLPSLIFVGMCFGSPVLNWVGEKIGSYLTTIIGAGVGMAFCFFALLLGHLSVTILTVSFVFVGICSAYQILAIYKASTYVRQEVAGLTTAVSNMIIMIFGYGFHSIIGQIIHHMGGPQNSEALMRGIYVIPVALCLGSLGFIGLSIFDKSKAKTKVSPQNEKIN